MPYRSLPPRRVFKVASITAATTTPLSFAILAAWVGGWLDEHEAATVVMVYTFTITLAITAAAVAAVAAAYSAVPAAFSAGFQTGQASVDPGDPDPLPKLRKARQRGESDPLLKLVE